MFREKRSRALLAELGVSTESAAVSLKAAKDALLKCLPDSEAHALPFATLFELAMISSRTIGQKAIQQLHAAGVFQRVGAGAKGDPFKYFCGPR